MSIAPVPFAHVQAPAFTPLNIAVLSLSDGDVASSEAVADLVDRLLGYGHRFISSVSMPEDDEAIRLQVQTWIDEGTVDVVLLVDNTILSAGDMPPSVVLTSDSGAEEIYSTLVQDPEFGFVAIVNILSAQQMAA